MPLRSFFISRERIFCRCRLGGGSTHWHGRKWNALRFGKDRFSTSRRHKNTHTQIHVHKYMYTKILYTNTCTQIHVHKYMYTNTRSQIQVYIRLSNLYQDQTKTRLERGYPLKNLITAGNGMHSEEQIYHFTTQTKIHKYKVDTKEIHNCKFDYLWSGTRLSGREGIHWQT